MAGKGKPGPKSWKEQALENSKLLERAKDELDMLTQKLVDEELRAEETGNGMRREYYLLRQEFAKVAEGRDDARTANRVNQEAHARSLAEWNAKRRAMKVELRKLRTALGEAERRAEVTLADHYAGHAMEALTVLGGSDADEYDISHDAYRRAGAMLDVRRQIGESRAAEIREEGRQALQEIGDYFARVERPEESD